jgi:hypothetical protein
MLRGVGLTRSQILVKSALQPTRAGHRLFAEIVAYTMQQTLAEELRQIAAGATTRIAAISEERSVRLQQVQQLLQQLPPPVGPLAAEEVDGDPLCAMDKGLQNVVMSSVKWNWGTDGSFSACPHDHCRVWGYRWGPLTGFQTAILQAVLQLEPQVALTVLLEKLMRSSSVLYLGLGVHRPPVPLSRFAVCVWLLFCMCSVCSCTPTPPAATPLSAPLA